MRNQKKEIAAKGDSPILTKAAEVVDFIRRSFLGEVRDTIKAYGKVGTQFADRVRNATSGTVSIDGYYLELDSNMISHMEDHVGKDKDPRSIPLTVEQLEQLPEYIDTFDDLIEVIRRKDGSVRLMLGKKINGHSIIIEAVSKGRSALHPVTAYQVDTEHYNRYYKTKAVDRSSTSRPANASQVDISRQTTTSGRSIPQATQKVKAAPADEITRRTAQLRSDIQAGAQKHLGKEGYRAFEADFRNAPESDPVETYQQLTKAYNEGMVNRRSTDSTLSAARYNAMFEAGRRDAEASQ